MKALVIEDNPRLADRIKDLLRKQLIVEVASSGDQGIAFCSTNEVDIILLDLGLPDMSGLEVCQKIRELNILVPLLVVSGIDELPSKVNLLNAGADDYITKPFDASELRARVDALLRRRQRNPLETKIKIGDIVIYPSKRIVTRSGVEVKLRRKEFDILEYLAVNYGRVLSRQMIINHAWNSTTSSWPGSVDVHIKQLRDKIDKPFNSSVIKTTYGVGYSLSVKD